MTPLENHTKNLAWIDARIENRVQQDKLGSKILELDYDYISDEANSLTANRKVLERHAPDDYGNCLDCKNYYFSPTAMPISVTFPCPTYTDITEGLGIPNE